MDAIQSFAVLAVGVGTLPIAIGIARCALTVVIAFVLKGGDRHEPRMNEISSAVVTVV
jgi:hypothetical protein